MSCPSSIRRRDSNPRPLERESTPITTRPGLVVLVTFTVVLGAGSGLFFCKNLLANSLTEGSLEGMSFTFSLFFFSSSFEFWRENIWGTTSGGGLKGEESPSSRSNLEELQYRRTGLFLWIKFACIGLTASTSGLHIRWIDLKKVCGMLAPFWIWGVFSTFWWGLVVCASPVSFRVCIFHNQKMHVYLICKHEASTLTPFVKPPICT